jgi:hypothetical protein
LAKKTEKGKRKENRKKAKGPRGNKPVQLEKEPMAR